MSDNESRKTIKKLWAQRDEARTELESFKTQLQQLQQNVTAEAEQATARVTAVAAVETNGLRNELATKEHRIEVLEVALLKTEQERDTARNELTTSYSKYVGAQNKIEALTKTLDDPDIKSLRKRLHGKTLEVDRLGTQLKQTEEECRALALVAQRLQEEVRWLNGRVEALSEPKRGAEPAKPEDIVALPMIAVGNLEAAAKIQIPAPQPDQAESPQP